MAQALKAVQNKTSTMKTSALRRLLLRAVAGLISAPKVGAASLDHAKPSAEVAIAIIFQVDQDILHYLVFLPIRSFTSLGIAAGVDAWTWLIAERPSVQVALLNEIASGWLWTIRARRGLFSNSME
jgi:phosphatidylinositol 4-kinase